jgi:uncharacterized integral membrane protein
MQKGCFLRVKETALFCLRNCRDSLTVAMTVYRVALTVSLVAMTVYFAVTVHRFAHSVSPVAMTVGRIALTVLRIAMTVGFAVTVHRVPLTVSPVAMTVQLPLAIPIRHIHFPINFSRTSLLIEDNTATFTCSYVRPPWTYAV